MNILFLSTWFPYPPSQGSKIRAYQLLRALAGRHNVTLATFAESHVEPSWEEHLRSLCTEVAIIPGSPFAAQPSQRLRGWLSWQPATVAATYSGPMAEAVTRLIEAHPPDVALAMTYVMAPYLPQMKSCANVLDVDNLMAPWMHELYAGETRLGQRVRRWMAWQKFRRYEAGLCRSMDQCLVLTLRDRDRLAAMMGAAKTDAPAPASIQVVPNGVDCGYHRPGIADARSNRLIYSGALTYSANYDAMEYFLSAIYPSIRSEQPDVSLAITGSTKGVDLASLALDDSVTLTGFVDDVRIPVGEAAVCVVPLRLGAGTRLKILEAMALGTPVVSTSKGAEGLDVTAGEHLLIADTPEEFAQATLQVLRDSSLAQRLAHNARSRVTERYDWSMITQELVEQLEHKADGKASVQALSESLKEALA